MKSVHGILFFGKILMKNTIEAIYLFFSNIFSYRFRLTCSNCKSWLSISKNNPETFNEPLSSMVITRQINPEAFNKSKWSRNDGLSIKPSDNYDYYCCRVCGFGYFAHNGVLNESR